MNHAELSERIQALPPDKQAEVLDFVDFLVARHTVARQQEIAEGEWTRAEFSKMAMSQAMRGMEEEPPLYTLDDLKERWR